MGLQVAFATDDLKQVNQHFGATRQLAIYDIDPEAASLKEVAEFASEAMDGNENKLPVRLAALEGCAAVYCLAVGGSAAKQMLARGVNPVRLEHSAQIESLIRDIQHSMQGDPAPWMRRAADAESRRDPGRFEDMLEESWEE
ncbi:putative dinitrogenase iron-molybdenum cofactor biosynthesis nifX [Magnetofaba australis IT-1]|uniref:Putative dinitrogenase iron-molybdenum cofactor biosynthesis nifX n=2 Tax=Magnetofaba TaxID=1472292 RepID=A0A1Y2K6G0_9PROT|nr:putative dinitrogenase iron-molybdenum cofactor biosynthesis nifX [Magnetofaba australis IT-1]